MQGFPEDKKQKHIPEKHLMHQLTIEPYHFVTIE